MDTMKTMATVYSYENKCATNYSIITTIGTTRTTSSSPSTTPMTTLTHCTCTWTDAWRTCTESARTAHLPQFMMTPHTSWLNFRAHSHFHLHGHPWRTLFDSFFHFYFYLFLMSVPVFLFHLELFLELHYTIVMANLRCSAAEESEETLNSFTSLTGYEPNLLTFGELNDSSVPFSFMISFFGPRLG